MNTSNRVFITGRSALTASGETADKTWQSVISGTSGIGEIKQWDVSSWSHRLGGELKNFQPANSVPDRKLIKSVSRHDVMGINAAMQAIEQSQILPFRDSLAKPEEFNERTGVYVGSPGNKYCQQYDFLPLLAKTQGNMQEFARCLFDEVHPMWLLRILPNNVLAYTGMLYGFKGPNHNVTNHAVGGMQALLEAYQAIRCGQADRAVVVAYDLGTEPQGLFYYQQLGVLSARHLKPFDEEHDGTLLAEGAAALILESEASAQLRKATCYAELLAGMSATESTSLFSIESQGQHLQELIKKALQQSNINPKDLSMVVAHGNGNQKSDESEAHAISALCASTPVTAFKWSMGHTLAASGVVDTVLATYALETRSVPGIANLNQLAPSCRTLSAQANHQPFGSAPNALVINRGFAGMNACLVMRAAYD